MTLKTCKGCGASKPASEYHRGGKSARCKACINEAQKVHDAARSKRRTQVRLKRGAVAAFDAGLPEDVDPAAVVLGESVAAEAKETAKDRAVRERAERADAERKARLASSFDSLKPDDLDDFDDVGVANAQRGNKAESGDYSRTKRQEYNRKMGEFATDLRTAALRAHERGGEVYVAPEHAAYIAALAEQETRFGNRRWARSVAIAEAHEQMSRRAMIEIARTYFANKVEPVGYARFAPDHENDRTVCLLLSDLHFGAELDVLDEPVAFRAIEEARRLEFVLRQFLDYKPQHREKSDALLFINGDVIEGQLMHDFRAGAPLAEQKAIFWSYMRSFVGHVAAAYRRVRIVCQPGNHGRDKVRHPGRATARKWDGHEWECYIALREMCRELLNVEWQIDFRAVSAVNVHGSIIGAAHGDTEPKMGDPDTKAKDNAGSLDRVNNTSIYGISFDAWVFGHYHKPRFIPGNPSVLYNAALVPPNGHARASGYIGEACGQFLWEAVAGFPIGDVRFIGVGQDQDHDERLGKLIRPFRFRGVD